MLLLKIKQFSPVILFCALVVVGSLYFNLKDDYAKSQSDLAVEKSKNETLTKNEEKTNKELEANSRKIQGLINDANKTSENLKTILKNNQCANTPMPNDAINILRNKGISTNKAADTSKPDTAKRNPNSK